MSKIRLVYDGKELSQREKGIYYTAMAIGVFLGALSMGILSFFGFV